MPQVSQRSNRSRIIDLVDDFEPVLRDAFLSGINDITSNAGLGRIVKALERRDIEGALRSIHLDPAAFSELDSAVRAAYDAGGSQTTGSMPIFRDPEGKRFVVRFDARNPRAEEWLKTKSSDLVTAIVDDQRTAIRDAMKDGLERGENPRTTALNIVGRINPQTKRREGGIVGLTAQQAQYVATYANELAAGDAKGLRNSLTRAMRDKRFDKRVIKSIETGKGLDAETRARMVARYSGSLLKLRGDTIARTEAIAALHASQTEAFAQVIEKGAVKAQNVKKIWRSASDRRVRDTHAAMDGQSVSWGSPFRSPSGATIKYPCDPDAPASERIQCRCWQEIKVNHLSGLASPKPADPTPQPPNGHPLDAFSNLRSAPSRQIDALLGVEALSLGRDADLAEKFIKERGSDLSISELEAIVQNLYGYLPDDSVLKGLYGSIASSLVGRKKLLINAANDRIWLVSRAVGRRLARA